MNGRHLLALLIVTGTALAADLPRGTSPPDARVYIISPMDGATVTSPVTVRFGLSGMGIAPAHIHADAFYYQGT